MLLKYFVTSDLKRKQGIIFCVSVQHAKDMAACMQDHGISVKSVSGKDGKSSVYIKEYQEGGLQFLTTCSLLNEGWDSPQTSIIVMARPTMSQVLYTQQLGRGTRKCAGKEALYVIDVVDNYGGLGKFNNSPWSIHGLLGIAEYLPWGDVLNGGNGARFGDEVVLAGLYEQERKLEKINIFTFEKEYPDHLSEEQLARELFVSTGTVKKWILQGKLIPDVVIPIGRKKLCYFSLDTVPDIINMLNLKPHNDETQYNDFLDFMKEGNYSMSYKMVMMLSMLHVVDNNGECNLDDLLNEYSSFYKDRISNGLPVDKDNCPYNLITYLEDSAKIKISLLQNPFEKFERKRFLYHCKDLNHIAFSNNLWMKLLEEKKIEDIKNHYFRDLIKYYENIGGLYNQQSLTSHWGVESVDDLYLPNIVEFPSRQERYNTCVPYYEIKATAGKFNLDQSSDDLNSLHQQWMVVTEKHLEVGMFVMQIVGESMSPKINDGDFCLFRTGTALGGTRNGKIVLVKHHSIQDPSFVSQYTVKRYKSEKTYNADGSFYHTKIILQSINSQYNDIVIEGIEDEDDFRVLAEFVSVL